HRRCPNRALLSAFVEDPNRAYTAAIDLEISRKLKFAYLNFGSSLSFCKQGPQNLPPAGITMGVKNTIATVRTLAAEGQLCAFPIELRSPSYQLLNALRSIFYQNLCRFRIAEPVAGIQGVL